jgi:hypothetical protein
MDPRNKKRAQLVMLFALFFAPMLVAAVLALTGWMPGTRSYGEGIIPQRSVIDVPVELAEGGHLEWRDPEWRWSLVALPGKQCGAVCLKQLDMVHRARISLNQNAKRVRLVYLGEPPSGADAEIVMPAWTVGRDIENKFSEWVPKVDDGLALVMVKPDGTALTFYRDGFEASGMRKDLAKVTK